jgi:RNA polymerase sigma-70 factor (ECF subfamily)
MGPLEYLSRLRQLGQHLAERRRRLYRLACLWCRNRTLADDLVQETFLRALRNPGQLRDISAMDAWMANILFNCWRDHLRRQRHHDDIAALAENEDLAYETDAQENETVRRVWAAIARLPAAQQEVLILVDLAGCSYAEVALMLEVPIGTVTSRISRARARRCAASSPTWWSEKMRRR